MIVHKVYIGFVNFSFFFSLFFIIISLHQGFVCFVMCSASTMSSAHFTSCQGSSTTNQNITMHCQINFSWLAINAISYGMWDLNIIFWNKVMKITDWFMWDITSNSDMNLCFFFLTVTGNYTKGWAERQKSGDHYKEFKGSLSCNQAWKQSGKCLFVGSYQSWHWMSESLMFTPSSPNSENEYTFWCFTIFQ